MNRPAPAEFAEFVRDVSIRALDRMADRMKELATEQRGVVRAWSRLSKDAKDGLLSQVIAAALSSAPAFEEQESEPVRKREIHRYDPEEVASTLPAKPAKTRKKSTKKKPTE